jgi:hypothetical protein
MEGVMSQAAIVSLNQSKRVKIQTTPAGIDDFTTLRAVCVVLQAIAQKYVPDSAFEDRSNLVQCLNIMQELGVNCTPKTKFAQFFEEKDTDKCSLSYRLLKSRAVAALATIADLDKKCFDRQGNEYKNGMRDAYKRASEIAIMFLADIQGESLVDAPSPDSNFADPKPRRCAV